MDIEVRTLKGAAVLPYKNQISRICFDSFAEFPYLTKPSGEHPFFLINYFDSQNSNTVLFLDQDKLVGFSGSRSLREKDQTLRKVFEDKKLDPNKFLYVDVILVVKGYSSWQRINYIMQFHAEAAKASGLLYLAALTVDRSDDHPERPADYRSLDKLWERFGWTKFPSLRLDTSWVQVNTNMEEKNSLSVWINPLNSPMPFVPESISVQ